MQTGANQTPFITIVPCLASLNPKEQPKQCNLLLKVSDTEVSISVSYISDPQSIINFNYKEYDRLVVYFTHLVFENNSNSTNFYFFHNPNDLKRFFFTLIDSGLLLAEKNYIQKPAGLVEESVFKLFKNNTFIPDGNYGFASRSLMACYCSIVINQLRSIHSGCNHKIVEYFNRVFLFIYLREQKIIEKWQSENSNRCVGHFQPVKQQHLLKSLCARYITLIKNLPDISTIDLNRFSSSEKVLLINRDINSFNFSNEKYIIHDFKSDSIISDCNFICKNHYISTQIPYQHNDFKFPLRFLLLIRDFDKTSDLISGELTKNKSYFGCCLSDEHKDKSSSLNLVLAMYSHVMESLRDGLDSVLSNISDSLFPLLKITSAVYAFCTIKQISQFNWLRDDISSLFSDTFCSPWPIWLFFLMSRDVPTALVSIVAAIVFSISPELQELNITDQKDLFEFWIEWKNKRKNSSEWLSQIVNLAAYYYGYSRK